MVAGHTQSTCVYIPAGKPGSKHTNIDVLDKCPALKQALIAVL